MYQHTNGNTSRYIYELHVTSKMVKLGRVTNPNWKYLSSLTSLHIGYSTYTRQAITNFVWKEANV